MKIIVVIGASGFVGSAILNEALDRGYNVTAVVRNAGKITVSHPNLKVVIADVSSVDTVSIVCEGMDAVISAYNPGWANPNIYEDTLRVYPTIVKGVKRSGVKRLLCVGGAGSLLLPSGVRVLDSGAIPDTVLPGVKGLAEFYTDVLLHETELDWVFFAPAGSISSGERTGKFRLGKNDLIIDANGISRISVEDYAMAMIDELEDPEHHRERFTIGY